MKNRFEVRPLDERKRLLWRTALWGLPGLGELAAKPGHLCPREQRQIETRGCMPQQHVHPVFLDGIYQEQGMVGAYENLELTQLVR